MELYGNPLSDGTIKITYDKTCPDSMIIDKPFYMAVTHSAIEDALETPLIIAKIGVKNWKKA
jgi:hypothetical protein